MLSNELGYVECLEGGKITRSGSVLLRSKYHVVLDLAHYLIVLILLLLQVETLGGMPLYTKR